MFRLPVNKIAASSTSAIARCFSTISGPRGVSALDEAKFFDKVDKIFRYAKGAGAVGSGLYFASGMPRSDKPFFFMAGALLVPAMSAGIGLAGISAALLYAARHGKKSKISAQQSAQPSPPSPRP